MENIPLNSVVITRLVIVEKTSKKGNSYKCIVAIDQNEKQHFVCFVK